MVVTRDLGGDYQGGGNTDLKLESYQDDSQDTVLMYGISSTTNTSLQNRYSGCSRKILLNLWDPCSLYLEPDHLGHDFHGQVAYFDEVWSICPYSVKWKNTIGGPKFYYSCYPFDESLVPPRMEKVYDVCFTGGIYSGEHAEAIDIISRFNYRYASIFHHPKVTDYGLSNSEKFGIVAQTKICVCYNLLYLKPEQVAQVKRIDRWEEHEAFSQVDSGLVPQYKSRVNESAFCRTLILIKRDPWNIVEDFYEPGVDFVYFNSNAELERKIREILGEWEYYSKIAGNAYGKVMGLTSRSLVGRIKGREGWVSGRHTIRREVNHHV
jgi:hypothetical protein